MKANIRISWNKRYIIFIPYCITLIVKILFEDIDECASSPCQNGGSCTDQVYNYTCSCVGGYGGANCENDYSDPCFTPQYYIIDALNETHSSGVIFSPDYPSSYPNSASCSWYIIAEEGQIVQFTFTEFDLENK